MDVEKEHVEALLFQQLYGLRAAAGLGKLGIRQELADLVDQGNAGVLFVVDHGNAHEKLSFQAISGIRGGTSGMEKETVEPFSLLSMVKLHWSP